MKKIYLFFVFFILILPAIAQTLLNAPFPTFSITSDFGPRRWDGSCDFHEGIVYGQSVGSSHFILLESKFSCF